MGLFTNILGKKKINVTSNSAKEVRNKSKDIILINNRKGGFDAFGALYRHTLQEISVYMDTKSEHPIQDILRKSYQAPITFVNAYYHTGLKYVTYIFSYPASSKLLNNPRFSIAVCDLFKDKTIDIVTVTAIYELSQIKLQNSRLIVDGHPSIDLMPEDSSEYIPIDDYQKDYELVISSDRFYIASANIKNTPVHEVESDDFIEENMNSEAALIRDFSFMSGFEFEQYCKKLLLANGFSKADITKSSHDYGGDILAEKDQIKYIVQCKRYSSPVGIDAVQQAIGSKSMYNCHVAVVMTNNVFTESAKTLASKNNVILWDSSTIKHYQENLTEEYDSGPNNMDFYRTEQSMRDSQVIDSKAEYNDMNALLPNGDGITFEKRGDITTVVVNPSTIRLANICMAMITTAAERYESPGIGARVTYNGETRSVTNIAHINGNEFNTCTWTGTVTMPLNEEEKEYAKAVYCYTKGLLGIRHEMNADDISNHLYCKYNYTFVSGCLMGQELHQEQNLFFQIFIQPHDLSDAIVAYAFYSSVFLKKMQELNYGYSFSIIDSDATMFMYKEPGSEEVTVCMDEDFHPTTTIPKWTKMVGIYQVTPFDEIKLKSFGSCFIEFINNINLLSEIED